jgi:hypothetical protein
MHSIAGPVGLGFGIDGRFFALLAPTSDELTLNALYPNNKQANNGHLTRFSRSVI